MALQAPLLQGGLGVGLGTADQLGLFGRVDLHGVGHPGRPPVGELAGQERLGQGGLVDEGLPQTDQVLCLSDAVPGRGGQELGRRAVAGAGVEAALGQAGRERRLVGHHLPLEAGQPAEHLGGALQRTAGRVGGVEGNLGGVEKGEQALGLGQRLSGLSPEPAWPVS